jgi:hypothetical protein
MLKGSERFTWRLRNRRRLAGQAVPMRLSLKTAPLREHDQESWVLFVDLVKAYDTVNREMLWKIHNWSTRKQSKCSKSVHGCYDQLQSWWETWTVSLDKQSQGDNLAPVLFIFVIHAVSNTLDKKWDFTTPDFRWFRDTQVGSKPRGQLRTNPPTRAPCSRSSSPIMSAIRPSFFSAAEWSPPQAYRLSLSTFWSDYSHWKYEKRRRLENGGHSLSEAWTGIIGCWYGGHRNRRRPLYVLCIKFK